MHGVAENEALPDAAFLEALFHLGGDVDNALRVGTSNQSSLR